MLATRKFAIVFTRKRLFNLRNSIFWFHNSARSNLYGAEGQKGGNFIVFCNTQITKNGRNGNIEEAESVFNRMPRKSTVSWTAMLTAYAENGKIEKARQVFDEMPERTIVSYNAMITAYLKSNSMVDEAYGLFRNMSERNAVTYASMITGLVRVGMFDKAKEVYAEVPLNLRDPVCSNSLMNGYLKIGRLEEAVRVFEAMEKKDVVSWSSMVDGYCKGGRVLEARVLFDQMPERNVVSWTAMINGYMKTGCFEDGFGLFSTMRKQEEEGNLINSTTLTTMFEACGSYGRYLEGIQIHGLVSRMGFAFDVFLGNSIITMYCKFSCLDEATELFQVIREKDLVSWNSLIAGYVKHGKVEEAFELFEKMPRKDVVSWTTMITGFSSKGSTRKALELFGLMPVKDDIAWTAMISGFVSNEQFEEAFHWFIAMLRESVRPNPLTFSSMLSASAGLANLKLGLEIHAQVVKLCLELDLSIQNSLVSMYSKCGDVGDAYRVFTTIDDPNIVSFNSMITAFAQNGYEQDAIRVFRKMQSEGHEPNQITFLAVLSACSHGGLVEAGWECFNSMKSPEPDHYACMVDLLGRAGLLDDAINLIHSMPFEPHAGVWGALLGASETHLRPDLAKLAADRLTKLEPDNAAPYVILSRLYSAVGKKKDGDEIRMTKKLKGVRKTPGCSWVMQ